MLLGNTMMDDKQLNFSRPLLSVRRHSSTPVVEKENKRSSRSSLPAGVPRPPQYKSDLKSGPMRNPGTVPFQWERSPGRPKDERSAETHVAPKLPPGRNLIANQQDNGNVSTNAVASRNHDRFDVSHFDDYGRGGECHVEEKKAESDDEDEVYEDALDTLSRAESSFLNCSMSGVSGLDDADVKPSIRNLNDPQAKEFLIGRFLPAAKAMTTEAPHYAPPKKQPSTVEDYPRQMKKVVKGDKVPVPQLRYGPSFAKHYSESQYTREEESDDEDGEYENFNAKACGLLPKFCLKSSLCLLNPLPAVSVRTRGSTPRRVPAGSSSASSYSKTENEHSSFDDSEQRSIDGSLTEILDEKNDISSTNGPGNQNESHSIETGALPAISADEKGYKSFRELLADENMSEEVASGGPSVEKTVYIDTMNKGNTPDQKTVTFASEGLINIRGGTEMVPMKMVETTRLEDSLPVKNLSNGDRKENAAISANFQVSVESLRRQAPKVSRHGNFHGINAELPVPPPLPNSPSDSWLCRTLPSMSLKNSSKQSHFGTGAFVKDQALKTQSGDPKWETIVKATKVHHQHLRYSEELLDAIPEN